MLTIFLCSVGYIAETFASFSSAIFVKIRPVCYVVKNESLFSNPVQYLPEHPVFVDQSCKIRNVVDFDISNWNKRS